jgi:hypothetical protein
MGKATDSYASHQREIGELQIALDKAYEYDRNRPLNEITVKMWDKLLDPQGALLGGFLLGMTATQYLWIIRSKASWPS